MGRGLWETCCVHGNKNSTGNRTQVSRTDTYEHASAGDGNPQDRKHQRRNCLFAFLFYFEEAIRSKQLLRNPKAACGVEQQQGPFRATLLIANICYVQGDKRSNLNLRLTQVLYIYVCVVTGCKGH